MLKKRPARRVWALAFGHHEDHTRRHGYDPTRAAVMAAFAKSWRREFVALLGGVAAVWPLAARSKPSACGASACS